jgi:shikimate dehydrogenase
VTSACLRLAVLGDPLSYTLSPVLHRAGLASVGLEGTSEALRTPVESLGERLRELGARGYRGLNLTVPLKEAALVHLDWVTEPARRSRSVNTVSFDDNRWHGDTTDGPGFVDLLGTLGRSVAHERVVLLGGGGAARSLALALAANGGANVTASVRDPGAAAAAWREVPNAILVRWRSAAETQALHRATLVVNATPLGEAEDPVALERLDPRTMVIDLRYQEQVTPWIRRARSLGLLAYDGLGLLVFQARRSLELWTGREVPVDPLARAVGWPR